MCLRQAKISLTYEIKGKLTKRKRMVLRSEMLCSKRLCVIEIEISKANLNKRNQVLQKLM